MFVVSLVQLNARPFSHRTVCMGLTSSAVKLKEFILLATRYLRPKSKSCRDAISLEITHKINSIKFRFKFALIITTLAKIAKPTIRFLCSAKHFVGIKSETRFKRFSSIFIDILSRKVCGTLPQKILAKTERDICTR
jgi:hypothetical protein